MIDPPNPEVAEEELRKRKQREEERKKRKAKVGIYVMVSLLYSDSSLSFVLVLLSVTVPPLSLPLPLPPSLPLPQLARYREKVREQQRTGREQTNILEIYQHMTSVRRAIQGAENILEEYLVSPLFTMYLDPSSQAPLLSLSLSLIMVCM